MIGLTASPTRTMLTASVMHDRSPLTHTTIQPAAKYRINLPEEVACSKLADYPITAIMALK